MTAATGGPIRVVVASHSAVRIGGVESYVSSLVPALVAAGHEVACWFEASGAGHDPVLPRTDQVPVWTADGAPDGLVPLVAAWRPDVVYTHGLRSPVVERQLMGVAPSVLYAHSYYGACVSGTKTWRVPVIQPCERPLGPACLASYYPRRCGGLSPATMTRMYRLQRTRRELLDVYARVLVASRHMADEFARNGVGGKVELVHLPVEAAGTPLPSSPPTADAEAPWRLLYLGRFEVTKGVDLALEAAALVASSTGRAVRLRLAGEGSSRPQIARDAAALMARHPNLHVEITGWLTTLEATSALDDSDLLLVPSVWPEPFGLVGVEAALRGVPSVAFDVGGTSEWLRDGVTGTLVPARPPKAETFAAAIASTLGDPGRYQSMREACLRQSRRFSMAAHVSALESVFMRVAREAGRAA